MKYHLGNYKSAVVLGKILQEGERKVSRKITTLVHDSYKSIKECEKIKHKVTKEQAFLLFYKEYIKRLEEIECPKNVETHTKCLLRTIYREALRRNFNICGINNHRILEKTDGDK